MYSIAGFSSISSLAARVFDERRHLTNPTRNFDASISFIHGDLFTLCRVRRLLLELIFVDIFSHPPTDCKPLTLLSPVKSFSTHDPAESGDAKAQGE